MDEIVSTTILTVTCRHHREFPDQVNGQLQEAIPLAPRGVPQLSVQGSRKNGIGFNKVYYENNFIYSETRVLVQ